MKKRYYVTDVKLSKHGYGHDVLTWVYAGREYQAEGEFYIDNRGIFITPFSLQGVRSWKLRLSISRIKKNLYRL